MMMAAAVSSSLIGYPLPSVDSSTAVSPSPTAKKRAEQTVGLLAPMVAPPLVALATLPVAPHLASAADWTFSTLPQRAKYVAQDFKNNGNPIVRNIGSHAASYLSNADFTKFYKTPELAGLTIAKIPITPLLAIFYAAMIPGRMSSEVKRAETMPNGQKDYRAVWDVVFRDVTSIFLFLFGLELLASRMLRMAQIHGTLPGGKGRPDKLHIIDSDAAFWSRRPELQGAAKFKQGKEPLIEGSDILSHAEMQRRFYLHNEGSLMKLVANPVNRDGLPHVLASQRKQMVNLEQRPDLHALWDKLERAVKATVDHSHWLDDELKEGLKRAPWDATEAQHFVASQGKQPYWRHLDGVRDQLFQLDAVNHKASVDALTLQPLREALEQKVTASGQALDQALNQLNAGDNATLKALLQDLRTGIGNNLTDRLDAFAHNKNKVLDDHLTQYLGLKKGTPEFKNQFKHYWNTLQELTSLAPVHHVQKQTLDVLRHDDVAEKALEGMRLVAHYSRESLDHLEAMERLGQKTGQPLQRWVMKAANWSKPFEPKKLLAEHAINLRTPSDWLSLVFIMVALGYFPVWFNAVRNNVMFELKHGQNHPASDPTASPRSANSPETGHPIVAPASFPVAQSPSVPAMATAAWVTPGQNPLLPTVPLPHVAPVSNPLQPTSPNLSANPVATAFNVPFAQQNALPVAGSRLPARPVVTAPSVLAPMVNPVVSSVPIKPMRTQWLPELPPLPPQPVNVFQL